MHRFALLLLKSAVVHLASAAHTDSLCSKVTPTSLKLFAFVFTDVKSHLNCSERAMRTYLKEERDVMTA